MIEPLEGRRLLSANLLVDGGFEPPVRGGAFYSAGQEIGDGWIVTAGTVDVATTDNFQAADGTQSVDLNGFSAGTLVQTIATTAGAQYTLTFAYAGNPAGGNALKTALVSWGGEMVASPTFDTTGHSDASMGWTTATYTLTATAVTTTLSFQDTTVNADDCGFALDDVSVTAAAATVGKTVGGLDPTFGTGGLASHDVGFTATTGVAADGSQSVLVGPTGAAPSESFGVTRYNADGSLDTSFGSGGVATAPFAGLDAVPTAVAVLAGGDVLVAGTATTYASDGVTVDGSQFAVAEFTPAGGLDPSFGTGGEAVFGFGSALSNDVLRAMAVGPGGVVYLGGSTDASGQGSADLAVAALTASGTPDTTFGTGGKVIAANLDVVNALAVEANGSVVAAGSAAVGGADEVAVARLLATGALDARFGTKGVATSGVGGLSEVADAVAIGSKGQIIVGGYTAGGTDASPTSDFLVQQYTAAGRYDHSFGKGGTATTSFGQPAAVTQVAVQADGSVVASGRTATTAGGALQLAVARYTTRGATDASFDGTGRVVVDLGAGVVAGPLAVHVGGVGFFTSGFGAATLTTAGAILSAGNSGSRTVEAQLVAAGVDLAAKLAATLPASVLAGAKGTATVTVTESGTTAAVGTVTIALQFATAANGAAVATVKTAAERVSLRQGQGKTYRLPFAYPTGLANGAYFLVATVTNGTGVAADLNAANNAAATAAAVQVAPPFVSLTGAALAAVSPFAAGKAATISITVTNGGNVAAKGKATLLLYLSSDGTVAGGTQVATVPLAVVLAAGKSKVTRLRFTLPAGTAAGAFDLLAVVDPDRALGPTDQTTATAVVAGALPVTVS